jgi:hypothetical protein
LACIGLLGMLLTDPRDPVGQTTGNGKQRFVKARRRSGRAKWCHRAPGVANTIPSVASSLPSLEMM